MSTAIAEAKPTSTLKGLLMTTAVKDQIATALPKHMTADRMIRAAMTAMLRTPGLAACDQTSFMQCMLTLSQLGLEPDGRTAHLIPFRNNKENRVDCQLIVDYKGLVELVQRSGKVSTIHADVVRENDDFEYDMGEIKRHKIDLKKPRGKVYAAYARIVMKDGTCKCEVMSREDIESVRSRSRAGKSGPWVTDWDEMAKKTVFRRASKWLSLSSELRDAVSIDDNQFEHSLPVENISESAPASRTDVAKRVIQQRQQTQDENVEQQPEPEESQDAVSEDEVNRLVDTLKSLEPDMAKRAAIYEQAGCNPKTKLWPRSGVEAVWDVISEINEANKE